MGIDGFQDTTCGEKVHPGDVVCTRNTEAYKHFAHSRELAAAWKMLRARLLIAAELCS